MNVEKFQCGHCGQTIAVASDHLNQDIQCPHCQQFITASGAAAPSRASSELSGEVSPAPAALAHGLDFPSPTGIGPSPAMAPSSRPRGQWGSLLLVFLIPYAVVTTGVIAWLLWKQERDHAHPLEWLLDQQPSDGGPKQIKHDLPLLNRQKTSLDKPIMIGEVVELTPLNVELAPKREWLTLTLRVRNTSSDLQFNPLPRSFLARSQGYTFLEFGKQKIYGGKLAYRKSMGFWANVVDFVDDPRRSAFDGILEPGEEMVMMLSTPPGDAPKLDRVLDHRGPMVWRLELRRGLALVGGKQVSATAVVGVEFDAGVLLRDQRELVQAVEGNFDSSPPLAVSAIPFNISTASRRIALT